MGPSILFDKSAIQSLGKEALREVSRYFYTTVPPVLLMETLADLSLSPDDLETAKRKVADIAAKVFPFDSIANAHYYLMCVHNLLGERVPMDRKPAVHGTPIAAKDGSRGILIDIQPEHDAVLRWRNGQFNADDLKFAIEWRHSAHASDLEAIKQALPKSPIKMRSLEQVSEAVELMLAQPELQELLLRWFVGVLRCNPPTCERIAVRWKWAVDRSLRSFAPYALHCLRVQLLYYLGMMQGFCGTRSSNVVDLEYLCYTPFAFVFCSGDKLHRQLAPFLLSDDQTFVAREGLQSALMKIAQARAVVPNVEPAEDSLVHRLWLKHWKKPPTHALHPTISAAASARLMESIKPIVDAIEEREQVSGLRFPV